MVIWYVSSTTVVMFSLSGATNFKYIRNFKDRRGGCDKSRGVYCVLDGRMEEVMAYVFTEEIHKRPLAKLTQDVAKQLGII